MSARDKRLPESMIGHKVTVESNRKRHAGSGVVEAVRYPPCTISGPNGIFRGVEFKIRREDGGYFWTAAFPDTTRPVS